MISLIQRRVVWMTCVFIVGGILVTGVQAQDDIPVEAMLPFDRVVAETISAQAFYDNWGFSAGAGSVVSVVMQASDGLAPLIGVLNPSGELIARSDSDPLGNPRPPAEPNSTATLEFVVPADGNYIVVATRVGNELGTTTGSYTIQLRRIESPDTRGNERPPVELRCGDSLMTVALVLEFVASDAVDAYRISVYGLDGLQPAIQVLFGSGEETRDCSHDSQAMPGDMFILPGEDPVSLPDDYPEAGFANAAQLTMRGGALLGPVQVALGSIDHQPGRYLLVVEGFTIPAAGADGFLEVRLAPWAQTSELLVYMIGGEDTRLDPYLTMEYADGSGDDLLVCDDAGRGDCTDVPPVIDAGVMFNDGTTVLGDRFDAGLWLAPGDTRRMLLTASSRTRSAHGEYALLFIGELPPREE